MKSKNIFASNLKKYMNASNITRRDLSEALGVSYYTITSWVNGSKYPRMDKVEMLAEYFGIQKSDLIEEKLTAEPPPISNLIPCPATRQVPIIGAIACGTPILAEQNVDGYAVMSEHVQADFALRCVGDSMIGARICDGDIVYIRKTYDFHNGDICAVLVEDEATLKRVYRISDSLVELRAENPSYPILRYQGQDAAAVRIIGKAVAFTSTVRH